MSKERVDIEKALMLAVEGLTTDGAHHKQWYLEQIILALGGNLTDLSQFCHCEWESGIAP